MRLHRNTPSGYVAQRSGNEGPKHDPYAFTETIVLRNGIEYRYHEGLGEWFKATLSGKGVRSQIIVELRNEGSRKAFETEVGMTLKALERALHHRPRMSRKEREEMEMIEAADAALLRYAM